MITVGDKQKRVSHVEILIGHILSYLETQWQFFWVIACNKANFSADYGNFNMPGKSGDLKKNYSHT